MDGNLDNESATVLVKMEETNVRGGIRAELLARNRWAIKLYSPLRNDLLAIRLLSFVRIACD